MKLSEIFNQLTYGELSQTHLGGAAEGAIDEANYPKILAHVNMGLLALHKRFPLKEGRKTLLLQPGILTYPLDAPEALKIERVYSADGWELGLNDESDPGSCFTPSAHILRVPALLETASVEVVFRAGHPLLTVDATGYLNPEQVVVELPYTHLEALLLYVASRVSNPMGMSNEFHAGNSYAAKYEAACQLLEMVNLRVDQGSQNTRLVRNGWV